MIKEIRDLMNKYNMDFVLFKDSDPHMSEYTNDYYKQRTKISGFTGSNGTLIVGMEDAYLFTDGRYFIQAENELKNTGIKLMKVGEKGYPSLNDFINDLISSGKKVFTNDKLISYKEFTHYKLSSNDYSKRLFYDAFEAEYKRKYDCFEVVSDIEVLPLEISGETSISKLSRVREKMKENSLDAFVSSDLAVNMWLFNIRGNAIPCNPVAFSYAFITPKDAFLFVYDSDKVKDRIDNCQICEYEDFEQFLEDNVKSSMSVAFDYLSTPAFIGNLLKDKKCIMKDYDAETNLFKAVKNDIEIQNIKKYYEKDNRIVKDFIDYVKNNDLSGINEYDLANKLDNMRLSKPECLDLSFDTISAFGPNAAMMHYEATEESNSKIEKDNLYLVDSGGQWVGATTDITRTVAIGNPTYKMKHDYTRVLRGLLHLQNAVFMEGVTGVNLDILARLPLWEEGDDYKCGTGHGIGYRLCVHEGPNSIRWRHTAKDAVLKPGMIMSDEPGIYREGEYGIRLENVILVKEKCVTNDGKFLCFEPLTYVPFDEDLILREEMSEEEKKWLSDYLSKC